MRWFIFFACIVSLMSAKSQDIKVHLHTHQWAGGVCCYHGVNYTYTIKIPKGEWQSFDSLLVCDNAQVLRYGPQKNTIPTSDTLVFNITYGHTYGEPSKEFIPKLAQATCTGDPLILVKGNQRKSLTVTSRTFSMVAYP